MPLVSIEFALCFLLFFGIYWLFIDYVKIQNLLLVMAGLGFLATWNWTFLLNVISVWVVTELCATFMARARYKADEKRIMQLGIALLACQLFLYKYLNFGIEQVNNLASSEIEPLHIILPLGISFYTFQAISYLADIYLEKTEKIPTFESLGIFSAFTTITAGPIFRPSDAIKQWLPSPSPSNSQTNSITANKDSELITNEQAPDNHDVLGTREIILPYMALVLIIVAVLKKVVLAGWLAQMWVSPIFANPLQYHPLEVLTGIYGYALQLFFDFSGYTDLVIAIGLLLGFRLPVNFNAPYLAHNIRDFWQRWHISLSHWIRDYLYIPLGGSRGSWWRTQFNLMLAFVISGMWHGAGWNFFIWGAIHGVALVWLNIAKRYGVPSIANRAPWLAIFITFHYVCFGWIFFHSQSLEQVSEIFTALVAFNDANTITLPVYMTLAIMLVSWLIYPWIKQLPEKLADWLIPVPWWLLSLPVALCLVLLFSLAPAGLPGFIYANF